MVLRLLKKRKNYRKKWIFTRAVDGYALEKTVVYKINLIYLNISQINIVLIIILRLKFKQLMTMLMY